MPGLSNISNVFLHNSKAIDQKVLFTNNLNIEPFDYNICNKYSIHRFNQYATANAKDYSF